MKKLPDDELLSAYLDDELADVQRSEVEAWLAEDASARQLLEELRSVHATLEGLPRLKLGEDLSARVLQMAERRMLTGVSAEDEDGAGPTPPPTSLKRFLNRRGLAWAGLAIAVALLIMVTEREQPAKPVDAPPVQQQAQRQDVPPVDPGTLEPMPDLLAKHEPVGEGGIKAAAQGPATKAEQPAIFLMGCYVREGTPLAAVDAILARQRIVRDDTQRLIDNALEQLGEHARQAPPAGWAKAGEPSYVYAEARSDQIEGLLQALLARPEEFPVVVSEPGRKVEDGKRQPLLLVIQSVREAEK